MKVVAFDAKKFQRIRNVWNADRAKEEKTTVFLSQLGIGVTIPEPEAFAKNYVEASQDLRREFDLDYTTPFFSSTCLKDNLSLFDAANFARQLISRVQDRIESVHCSYIALPDPDTTSIEVGGIRCAKRQMPAIRFIESLGSAFSYLTVLGYIWAHEGTDFGDTEMHVDSFRSRHTRAWTAVKDKAPVKIFYKGDECNPFISCADILAFYVDDTLAAQKLKLFPDDIKRVLDPHGFDTTVQFFDSRSQHHCAWQMDQTINVSSRLARPVVFLSIDRLTAGNHGQEDDAQTGQDESAAGKSRKADASVRQTEIYQAALKHAYQKNGCMKLFSAGEDKGIVKSGDVFIHAGPDSERISKTLQDMVSIRAYSGVEAVQLAENTGKDGDG